MPPATALGQPRSSSAARARLPFSRDTNLAMGPRYEEPRAEGVCPISAPTTNWLGSAAAAARINPTAPPNQTWQQSNHVPSHLVAAKIQTEIPGRTEENRVYYSPIAPQMVPVPSPPLQLHHSVHDTQVASGRTSGQAGVRLRSPDLRSPASGSLNVEVAPQGRSKTTPATASMPLYASAGQDDVGGVSRRIRGEAEDGGRGSRSTQQLPLARQDVSSFSASLARSSSNEANFRNMDLELDTQRRRQHQQEKQQRRRSMSSLGPSAAERNMQQHYAEQLQREEERVQSSAPKYPSSSSSSSSLPISSPFSSSSVVGSAPPSSRQLSSSGSSRGEPAVCAYTPFTASREVEKAEGVKGEPTGTLAEAPKAGISKANTKCMDWAAVEELCARLDAAGLQLEDIDILCLSPEADTASALEGSVPTHPLGDSSCWKDEDEEQRSSSRQTLLSLNFSGMALGHCAGQDQVQLRRQETQGLRSSTEAHTGP